MPESYPFQEKDMHLCAAKCCDSQTSSIDDVHHCVERCQDSTMMAQKFVQSELERFQESLSRCVLQCQDEVKDKVNKIQSMFGTILTHSTVLYRSRCY